MGGGKKMEKAEVTERCREITRRDSEKKIEGDRQKKRERERERKRSRNQPLQIY